MLLFAYFSMSLALKLKCSNRVLQPHSYSFPKGWAHQHHCLCDILRQSPELWLEWGSLFSAVYPGVSFVCSAGGLLSWYALFCVEHISVTSWQRGTREVLFLRSCLCENIFVILSHFTGTESGPEAEISSHQSAKVHAPHMLLCRSLMPCWLLDSWHCLFL